MDRINELLGKIAELSVSELEELRSLTTEANQADPSKVHSTDSFEELEILASAATQVKHEEKRRENNILRAHEAQGLLASFRTEPRHAALAAARRPLGQGVMVGSAPPFE